MSSKRYGRAAAIASAVALTALLVGACGSSKSTPESVYVSAPHSVCPIPTATEVGHVAEPIPATHPDFKGLEDPNYGDYAWSCGGLLYRWHPIAAAGNSAGFFVAYPSATHQWCRFEVKKHPQEIEYHIRSGGTCKDGRLVFTTAPDTIDGYHSWFDESIQVWLRIQDTSASTLQGDTRCQPNPWRGINLNGGPGNRGAYFRPQLQACLARSNAQYGLKQPPTFNQIKRSYNHFEFHLWFRISNDTPTCEDRFQPKNCRIPCDN